MSGFIGNLIDAVAATHVRGCTHFCTEHIKGEHEDQTVWKGNVEVFQLDGHPEANVGYGEGVEEYGGAVKYIGILQVPPFEAAVTTAKAVIASRLFWLASWQQSRSNKMGFGVFHGVMAAKVRELKEKARLDKKNGGVEFADERRLDDYDGLDAPRRTEKPPTLYQKIGHNLLILLTVAMATGMGYLIYLAWHTEPNPDPPRYEIPDE